MKLGELRKLAQAMPELQGAQLQQWVQTQLVEMGLDPNAIYQELEMTSRYVDTHRDVSWSNSQVQLHSHTFYELLYCCNSCGAEYMVGSERYRLQRGDILFVPPGVSHRPLLPENMAEAYERYVLWLSPEFLELYAATFPAQLSRMKRQADLLRTAGTPWESIGAQFAAGVSEAEQQKDGWESAVIGSTLLLLTQLRRATLERSVYTPAAEKPVLLDQLAAYVEKHYAEPINLNHIAKRYFVSVSTVTHLFKDKLGVSFYRYVTQRRLIAAKTLIEKGVSMQSIAPKLGFQDYSGFYRAFKQEYGISPRQYKDLCQR